MRCFVRFPKYLELGSRVLRTLKRIVQNIAFKIMKSFLILDLMKLALKEKILVLCSFIYAMLLAEYPFPFTWVTSHFHQECTQALLLLRGLL